MVMTNRHAAYSYSGPAAAWAYKALDLSKAKRVFVLGPSHTYSLYGCAVTSYENYGTPFGDLRVDREIIDHLQEELDLPEIPRSNDNKEHSLEMHLPYLWLCLEQTFGESSDAYPPVVPIIVGNGNKQAERDVGKWLARYLADPENAFIISSDFCHWGDHFDYKPYYDTANKKLISLLRKSKPAHDKPIHETIKMLDEQAIEAIKTGEYANFYDNLKATENTVCGRHPIGVTMAGLEEVSKETGKTSRFKFVKYDRSNLVEDEHDFSVSYVSAYAIA